MRNVSLLRFRRQLYRGLAINWPHILHNSRSPVRIHPHPLSLVTCQRFATSTIVETTSPTPDAILQTAFGFWNSKVLLTAVTFDLFTALGQHRLTGAELGEKLDLHPRGVADFLDALVAMEFLEREGGGGDAKYFNAPAPALYLDRNSPRYIGGIPEMLNARL